MLTLNDNLIVDIPDYEYIHDLKKWGPLTGQLVKVSILINILNKGIDVRIPDQYINEVYALVVQYNELAKESRGEYPTADNAQAELESILNMKVWKEDVENLRKSNPFITPDVAVAVTDTVPFIPPTSRSKHDGMKRKRLYEVIGAKEPESISGAGESTKFDEIDFSSSDPVVDNN